ncbi:DNA helicase/exodeoxyribonuclease V gamma subunit [Sphaerotilus hippei]|uniref:RecBCD enzyme subunit RecC n=1 Tax=Sphaerotilus hippei TaxID=744406 RepID=A0A318H9E9_9BURK|nr:exodeoxyribonuclease V subunit gamma [Sphaerotilus hippei]PXW94970.1 DNA helicase/exodeoxyribonuclease V gamma subunit [Sphaerotilus hippei]
MSDPLIPGLLVLHGNRLELLREAVLDFVRRQPPGPLEEEVYLVQSNGIAEWLKMALAREQGVCAATRVELPARFLWRTYRAMLGAAGAPMRSPLDEAPLAWRLMRLLASPLVQQPGYEPLAGFLAPGDVERRLQLAQRLADLYDQYQLYRADWLDDWAAGRDVLARSPAGMGHRLDGAVAVPDEQRWQPMLWRTLLDELDRPGADGRPAVGRHALRPAVHRRFVEALQRADEPVRPLPRRIVLFGHSNLPLQTLEALAALSLRSQILLAVPNPCQYHWADIIDGRELLLAARRRHGHRPAADGTGVVDLSALPLEQAHARAHPLLAAWGRQGRDFVRLLDEFDDVRSTQARFAIPRVDLFDVDEAGDGGPAPLLQQLQAAVRDLKPLDEHPRRLGLPLEASVAPGDRSITFHVTHGAQREVEVLHDQLLHGFAAAAAAGQPLGPRDVVVMVPDIEPYAPIIRAVFGRVPRGDARHIPFEITDVRQRGRQPLLLALEWLLRTPQRATASELRDLLEVPALARRFGVSDTDQPLIARWLAGAGVRWGLDEAHRGELGLQACGEANTWAFGVRRMLLGYATGATAAGAGHGGIEPYDEVGGLEAALAGSLAELLHRLSHWWALAAEPVSPSAWAERCRGLLAQFFDPVEERERLLVAAAHEALDRWLDDSDVAGFDEAVPLAVLREAWLGAIDEPGLNQRFLGGGVTFCTLMPMRAIPFEVVCLLGLNDGDYPRRAPRSDFDLMGLPGVRRPGDRARRDDDRYLLLEAVLSARRQLCISWAGRSARDQSLQPPSVLVAQLRDYLSAGWGEALPGRLTTEHPLQAFSRRYFEPGAAARGLVTYAREWREAHVEPVLAPPRSAGPAVEADAELGLATLVDLLKRPVRHFFRHRLRVDFDDADAQALEDDECFALDGLVHWSLLEDLLDSLPATPLADEALAAHLQQAVHRLAARGQLPLAGLGERTGTLLCTEAEPMARAWQRLQQRWPPAAATEASGRLRVQGLWSLPPDAAAPAGPVTVRLDDWIEGLRRGPAGEATLLSRSSSALMKPDPDARPPARVLKPEAVVDVWVALVVAAAQGVPLQAVRLGRDAVVTLHPPEAALARAWLHDLVAAWNAARQHPLPLALKTALAAVASGTPEEARPAFEGAGFAGSPPGERERDPALARAYPDFETLLAGLPDTPTPAGAGCRWTAAEVPEDPDDAPATRGLAAWCGLYQPLHDWARTCAETESLAAFLSRTEGAP